MYPIPRELLLGDVGAFTPAQRAARATYLEHFPAPPSSWLTEEDPANRIATGIYNTLIESGGADPRFTGWDSWQMAANFADLLKHGGDALVWTLIRIGIDESLTADFAELYGDRRAGSAVIPPTTLH